MSKFGLSSNKLVVQRTIVLSTIGLISGGILNGYINHEKQVSEYMQSLAYREAQESAKNYHVRLMKKNQRLLSSDKDLKPSLK